LSFRDGGNIISFPIHDEILVQSRAGWIGNAIELLTDHMTSVGHDLVVPMAVKVMVGPNWGDLHEPTANEACA
jgi:DNA polymerase I-like protein with 3'-5' exonuclease and polymerase domains